MPFHSPRQRKAAMAKMKGRLPKVNWKEVGRLHNLRMLARTSDLRKSREGEKQFEVSLSGGGGRFDSDYGFGMNPPIVVNAKSRAEAMKKLQLPKGVKVRKVEEV